MRTFDSRWFRRILFFLLIALLSMPMGVSAAERVEIGGQTEISVLKGKSYRLQISNISELIQKANEISSAGTTQGLGEEALASASVDGAAGITWSSTKKSVATVSKAGKLKAKKTGTTVITAQAGNFRYFCRVTVNNPVKKIKLNKTSKSVKCGKTYTLKATVKPTKNVSSTLKWTSSNKKVAKVNSKGKVTAVGVGSCKITAAATDGSGKKAVCKIKVTPGAIAVDKSSMTLSKGSTETLQVKNIAAGSLVWSSSDTTVASVSSDGVVTGVNAGTAVVSVGQSGEKDTARCTVTVVDTASASGASARAAQLLSILQKYSDQAKADFAADMPWTYSNSGTASTWASALASSGKRKVNCALLPRWALREMGIIDSSNFWGVAGGEIVFRGNVKEQLLRYCDIIPVYKTPSQLLAEGNLLPGDICTWKELQHTNVYAGDGLWYDSGRGVNYDSSGRFTSFGPSASMSMTNKTIGYIIRLR